MERDFAYRFTNEQYATKEEVKRALNVSSIDHIWETIVAFRRLYNKVLDLFSNEKRPYTICLSEGILNRYVKLEKQIMALSMLKTRYPKHQKTNTIDILNTMCQIYDFKDISETIINGIVDGTLAEIPHHYQIIDKYYKCLKDIESCYASPLNEQTIKRLFSILMHGKINLIDDINKIYRVTELSSTFDPYDNIRHYEGAPLKNIPWVIDVLFDAANESKVASLIQGSFIFYCILYFKPFEIYNEEMALLLTKYYFKHNAEDLLFLPFEKIILDLNDVDMKKIFLECESSLDLTYFTNRFFDYLEVFLLDEEKTLNRYFEQEMQQEILTEDRVDEEIEEKVTIPPTNEANRNEEIKVEYNQFEGITFERKVSMPVLPQGLDEKDASLVANNLIEICPTLKRGQAEFYARHCTIGKYYTIQQYKEANGVAYETARTSMDNLAELGFYKKEKIRNKFVYTPVIRS